MKQKYFYFFILCSASIIFIYFFYANIVRYYNFRTYWDLLSLIKSFQIIIGKDISANTLYLSGYGGKYIFHDHLYFSSLIYFPFYYLFQHPMTVMALHCLTSVFAYIFIVLTAYNKGLKNLLSLSILFFIFFLHPTIQGSCIRAVNATNISFLALAIMFWSFYSGRNSIYFLSNLLLILTREDMALISIIWNIIAIVKHRNYRIPAIIIIFSFIYMLLSFKYLLPAFNDYKSEHLQMQNYFGQLGNSYFNIIGHLKINFLYILRQYFQKDALFCYFILLSPFLFLPVLKPYYFLPVFPLISMNLVSLFTGMQDPKYYYFIPVIPFLFISFIEVFANINNKFIIILIFLSALAVSSRWGYLPYSPYGKKTLPIEQSIYNDFLEIKKYIPANKPLMTSEFLGVYFIDNSNLFVYDKNIPYTKYLDKIKFFLISNKNRNISNILMEKHNFKIYISNSNFTLLTQ